ncbi:MAG: o-succinylbenzoate synthase [Lishizhenia sp.]
MKVSFEKKTFVFKTPSGTSRGILTEKHAWFIYAEEQEFTAVGECSIIPGLSPDFISFEAYESKVKEVVDNFNYYVDHLEELVAFPSILMGVEMVLLNLKCRRKHTYFPTPFAFSKEKIKINGLIWMGEKAFMQKQISEKINAGFDCIKMKIGAIDFDTEIELISAIRREYPQNKIELRVDANGAFTALEAEQKLSRLAALDIHSIEQPIQPGQFKEMAQLCKQSKLPIALDEELIGVTTKKNKERLLKEINPQYIILKPSLIGGFRGASEWIALAESLNIGWWITSALESNVGLSAIAQFVSQYKTNMYQGLGTGALYTNNIESDLVVQKGFIFTKKV